MPPETVAEQETETVPAAIASAVIPLKVLPAAEANVKNPAQSQHRARVIAIVISLCSFAIVALLSWFFSSLLVKEKEHVAGVAFIFILYDIPVSLFVYLLCEEHLNRPPAS